MKNMSFHNNQLIRLTIYIRQQIIYKKFNRENMKRGIICSLQVKSINLQYEM